MTTTSKLLLTLSVLTFVISACTTDSGDKRKEGVVVERNKLVRPAWVDSPSDRLLLNSTETRFHHSSLKQRDLAIAVNQSQALAITASYDLWLPTFTQHIDAVPKIGDLRSNPKTQTVMNSIIDRVSHKIHTDVAKVEDIYYERIRIDNFESVPELVGVPEYFDVHTLVQLISIDNSALQNSLSDAMLVEKISEIKKFGKELSKQTHSKKH